MKMLTVASAGLLALSLVSAACTSATSTFSSNIDTAGPSASSSVSSSSTPSPTSCDSSLWDHVYHPARLEVLDPCKTVTGTISIIRHEPDGDLHILLKLDPQFSGLTNSVNDSDQHGDLVLEPVCEGTVTQADAVDACNGYKSPVVVPPVGTHVTVTGSYVLDTAHGWNEIHPITSMSATASTTARVVPGPFVTFLFSRTEQTVAQNCTADSGQPTLSGDIAPFMQSKGLIGFGTVNTVATKATDYCTHSNESLASSWSELQSLATLGWKFGAHEYDSPSKVATLTPGQQWDVTCGQAQNLVNHNVGPGTGLIAYPALQMGSTAIQDLQTNFGQHCFAWGRMNHTPGLTLESAGSTPPFWQNTQAMKGGPGTGSKVYTNPQSVINQINNLQPGQWLTIQVYALVTGTNPAGDAITWSCDQPGVPNVSNDVERYCWSDFQKVLNAAAAAQSAGSITVTDPLTAGIAFGRPSTYGIPRP